MIILRALISFWGLVVVIGGVILAGSVVLSLAAAVGAALVPIALVGGGMYLLFTVCGFGRN